jgi:hypothetical protein
MLEEGKEFTIYKKNIAIIVVTHFRVPHKKKLKKKEKIQNTK